MLVSLAVDLQTLSFDPGNDLPYPLFLPTYAATAWYHKALAPDLQRKPLRQVIAAAETFATEEYSVALLQGSRLPPTSASTSRGRWRAFPACPWSSSSAATFARTNGGSSRSFCATAGRRSDVSTTRFLGLDRDDAGEKPDDDPAMNNLIGAYAAGINRLLKDKLQFDSDAPYLVHAPLWEKWAWKDFANKYVNVGESLRRAIHANPHMRVYVASGLYDLGTPHAAGDFTVNHLGLRESLAQERHGQLFRGGPHDVHPPAVACANGEGDQGIRHRGRSAEAALPHRCQDGRSHRALLA
jgi:carboxypeptidase C (cathepsin A)